MRDKRLAANEFAAARPVWHVLPALQFHIERTLLCFHEARTAGPFAFTRKRRVLKVHWIRHDVLVLQRAAQFISTVRSLERRSRLDPQLAQRIIDDFWALPIRYRWNDAWVPRALETARRIGASRIYDSIYLACAESYGFTLYTCDESFVRAFDAAPAAVSLVH